MSKSDYLENAVLDHVLGGSALTQPAGQFVALCVSAPSDADTGATLPEITHTNGYARQSATFAAAAAGATSNSNSIAFTASGGSFSGIATHFAVLDSITDAAGNVLYHGALNNARTFNDGDTGTFAAGDLDVTED